MIPKQGLCLLFAFAWCAAAEVSAVTPTATGSVRGAYFSSSRDLDSVDSIVSGSAWLKVDAAISTDTSVTVEGWARHDHASECVRGQAKFREAYLSTSVGSVDIRAGKQIIAWGRADKLNPTDNLTPRDYVLLTADDEEQRLGARALLLRYHPQGTYLGMSAVWQPRVSPNRVPLRRSPGIVFSEQVPGTDQFALKLDRSGGEIDWSVSYLHGVDLNPDLELTGVSAAGVGVLLRHNRVRVLGMDAATVIGRYGLRAEAAYTWTESGPDNPWAKKPFLYLVAGGDRTFDNDVNVNLQLFYYRVSNYTDPRTIADPLARSLALQGAVASHQASRSEHGLSLRLSKKWLNDTLEGEIAAVLSLSSSDFVLKPKLVYAISDQLKMTVGAELFRGTEESFFGRLRDASTMFTELKYSF